MLEAARTAFTLGLNQAALGAAIVMALAAVLSAVYFRGVQVDSSSSAVAGKARAEEGAGLAA